MPMMAPQHPLTTLPACGTAVAVHAEPGRPLPGPRRRGHMRATPEAADALRGALYDISRVEFPAAASGFDARFNPAIRCEQTEP